MTKSGIRLIVLSWTALTAASLHPPAIRAAPDIDSQAQLLVRERANGDHSLLVGLDTPTPFDVLRLDLPVSWKFRPGHLPDRWSVSQDDKRLTARGQPLSSLRMRLDTTPPGRDTLASKIAQKKITVELFANGTRVIRAELTVTVMEKVVVSNSLGGALIVPRQITPGDQMLTSADAAYSKGSWEMNAAGRTSPLRRLEPAARGASDLSTNMPSKDFYLDDVPEMTSADVPLRFRYTDEWGDSTVDAPANDMRVASSPPSRSCSPAITGNTARAFAGQTVCVSGCFPQGSWMSLTVDGQQSVYPLAASMTTLRLWISDKTEPGPHEIRWSTGLEGAGGTATFRVLGLQGSIDQNLLWRGQSTTMRLQLIGTEEPLPLQIINRTPAIINVEGGVSQTVTSSGGAANGLQRNVRGIKRGDFAIDYELVDDSCGLGGPMRK